MNLMIVEDELLLRTSLAVDIPWEQHGIDIVGLAANGIEALELIDAKRPELVLLDIQMPKMDGLELAERIRAIDPDIQFVILSGHDSFAYAQRALELGVGNYLLKPAGEAEIVQAVLNAAETLRQELERRHSQTALLRKWDEHLPQLQDMFLQHWLNGKYAGWELERRSRELHIGLPPTAAYVVAVVGMDPLPGDESRFSREDAPLLQFSLHRIAEECLDPELCRLCTLATGETAVVFARPRMEGGETSGLLLVAQTAMSKLLTVVKECLKLTASAGISGLSLSHAEVPELFKQAYKCLQERIVHGNNIAIPHQETRHDDGEPVMPFHLEKELEIGLESGEADKALSALEEIWAIGFGARQTVEEVHEHVLYLSGILTRAILRQGWSVRKLVGEDFLYFQNVLALATKEQAHDWLRRVVHRFIEQLETDRAEAVNKTIRTLLHIVEQEMDKDVSLHTIADRLFVNASYLSRLFKRKMGKPFSVYLLEKKMEWAKQLLVEGEKVSEAAARTGFKDISYFARVFRKFWGVLPSDIKTGK